jgi:hypothetical protein
MMKKMTPKQQADAIRLLCRARGHFDLGSRMRVDMNALLSQLGVETITSGEAGEIGNE